MTRAIVHPPSAALARCELTFVARQPIDVARAMTQHEEYCRVLQECGVEVQRVTVSPDRPDAVFVEDVAVVLDELAVLGAMGANSRAGEVAAMRPVLAAHRRRVERIEAPATLEGGDVLAVGRTLYVGRSARTNDRGIAAFTALVEPSGYRVVPVAVNGCLHLKTACTALADDVLLANPDWVDLRPFAGMRIVEVDRREPFAANALRLPGALIVSAAHPRTNARITARGHVLRAIDIAELEKAEAGVTCLCLMVRGATAT